MQCEGVSENASGGKKCLLYKAPLKPRVKFAQF